MITQLSPLSVSRSNIESQRQCKPTRIARDFEELGIPRDATYKILLSRGVFKWMAVRRDLLGMIDSMKSRIRMAQDMLWYYRHENPDFYQRQLWKGYLAGIETTRNHLRSLAHGSRWQAPDNDPEARRWLESQ